MGNEMECVCDSCVEDNNNHQLANSNGIEDTNAFFALNDKDIKQSIYKDSFISSLDVLYTYVSDKGSSSSTKASLIKSNSLDSFFACKRNLLNYTKLEVNYYYNHSIISNYLSKNSIAFVIFQDVKMSIDDEMICSFNNRTRNNHNIITKKSDKKALYKVERINLMSLDQNKIKEQLLNDLHSRLQKQYSLNGIIVSPDDDYEDGELSSRGGSYSQKNSNLNKNDIAKEFMLEAYYSKTKNDFTVLYRKCKAEEYKQYEYDLDFLEGKINTDNINNMIFKHHNDKELVSVVQTRILKNNSIEELYCFIFKKYKGKARIKTKKDELINIDEEDDDDSFDYIVFDFTPGHSAFENYIKDICDKISYEKKATLIALVNGIDKLFLIFRLDLTNLDTEY